MCLALSIGGLEFRIEGAPPFLDAAMERYAAFGAEESSLWDSGRPVVIEARGRLTSNPSSSSCQRQPISLSRGAGDAIVLSGGAQGIYHAAARHGFVEDAVDLVPVDALMRLALSTVLPLEGSLLLHAAALHRPEGEGVALCGDSGTGKSTANSSLGGGCDELAVIHLPDGGDVELWSTPFWHGRRFRARCSEVWCLSRGREARIQRTCGVAAVRLLARHVVRYVVDPGLERAILRLVAGVCDRLPIRDAACPEGAAFIPFLTRQLGWKEAV
jgi:hypothetical protein